MNVAFCCDQFAVPGLYLSLCTLLLSNPDTPLDLFLIHEGLSTNFLELLRKTVETTGRHAKLTIREFSTEKLGSIKSFHGNRMTYARLFLADLLPEIDRIIYLDSDLLINCPLHGIWQIELDHSLLGAVPIGQMEWVALELDFFLEIGISKTATYFNAGVLLLDLAGWRAEQMSEACLDFLVANSSRCRTGDQTVLNGLFSQRYIQIPSQFNIMISPDTPSHTEALPPGIFHFVASPKPWDFLGKQLHRNWALYDGACRRMGIPRKIGGFSPRVVRTFQTASSYLRVVLSRWNEEKPTKVKW